MLTVLGAMPHCWAISAGVSPWRVAWIRAASRGLSEDWIASWSVLFQSSEGSSGRFIEGDVDEVERLEGPLALGSLLDGVDRPEEVGAVGRLTAQDVADAEQADLGQELVEAIAAERLEERGVDGLGAVVVLLGRKPRAVPGPAEVAVELGQAG